MRYGCAQYALMCAITEEFWAWDEYGNPPASISRIMTRSGFRIGTLQTLEKKGLLVLLGSKYHLTGTGQALVGLMLFRKQINEKA